jgi:DNA-directed RNA polymerase specialized sigma24 family protein
MPAPEQLADQFEAHRPHVRAVAYRMLGSVAQSCTRCRIKGEAITLL